LEVDTKKDTKGRWLKKGTEGEEGDSPFTPLSRVLSHVCSLSCHPPVGKPVGLLHKGLPDSLAMAFWTTSHGD